MGARMTDAFAKYGWCASIRGVENGGLVSDLPLHTFKTDDGEIVAKCPTEVLDHRPPGERAGQASASSPWPTTRTPTIAAFFSAQSCQKPFQYDDDAGDGQRPASRPQLPYILMTSRFAHYLKAIARDKIGSLMSRADCEKLAQRLDHATTSPRTTPPSAGNQAAVSAPRCRGSTSRTIPGGRAAIGPWRTSGPHYQLDELTVSLRLVSELPAKAQK